MDTDMTEILNQSEPLNLHSDEGLEWLRNLIRATTPAKDQTHWIVPGIGKFDLEGNLLARIGELYGRNS
jgi:hypothetical protein